MDSQRAHRFHPISRQLSLSPFRKRGAGWLYLAVIGLAAFLSTEVQAQELPRRALFGASIAPAEGGGVAVGAVTPGAAAARAGLAAGDQILTAGGTPIAGPAEFLAALSQATAGKEWPLEVKRGDERLEVVVTLDEYPRLTSPDYAFGYGAVEAEGALRRTIMTVPPGDGPHPAVLLLGGVSCYSLDVSAPAPHPYLLLRDALTRAGYATLWVEKSGVGDSQGVPCPEMNFETAVAGYRAGLAALRKHAVVDPDGVFLVGHSMGGLIAAILAGESDVAGVVAVETSGLPWFEYTLANLRRQLPLEGLTPAQVDAAMREALRANYTVFVGDEDPEAVFADHPSWAGFVALPQDISYMRQVAEVDPAAVWLATDAPALLIAGGSDFVTDPAEHEYLASVLNAARPGMASYVLIEDLDHFLNAVPDRATSYRSFKNGQPFGDYNPELANIIIGWLNDQSQP